MDLSCEIDHGRKRARCRGDRGATMAEYSLTIALVAVACIAVMAALGLHASGAFDDAGDGLCESPACTTTTVP